MDVSDEIPQRGKNTKKKSCLDADTQPRSPTSLAAAAKSVSKVLEDDNLLIEILLRVGFPTTLVHAALVCKRWLQHASDRAFLRCFRKLHPPRLLGFYREDIRNSSVAARFIPMLPQPPELAVVMRRASFSLDSYRSEQSDIMGCHNGNVLISLENGSSLTDAVLNPLYPERGLAALPPFTFPDFSCFAQLLFKEEGDGLSYLYVVVESDKDTTNLKVHVHMLQNGDRVWRRHLTLVTDQVSNLQCVQKTVLVDNKIYIAVVPRDIIILDLTTSSLSTIQLPQGVKYTIRGTTLARASDGSGVYLIHFKKLQLLIWLLKGGKWLLVDTICLREMVVRLRMSGCELEDLAIDSLRISHVGDYAEFVFLEMGRCILHLDVKCRQLSKVYVMTENDRYLGDIFPFMMIWLPTFPALKDDSVRERVRTAVLMKKTAECCVKKKHTMDLVDG